MISVQQLWERLQGKWLKKWRPRCKLCTDIWWVRERLFLEWVPGQMTFVGDVEAKALGD